MGDPPAERFHSWCAGPAVGPLISEATSAISESNWTMDNSKSGKVPRASGISWELEEATEDTIVRRLCMAVSAVWLLCIIPLGWIMDLETEKGMTWMQAHFLVNKNGSHLPNLWISSFTSASSNSQPTPVTPTVFPSFWLQPSREFLQRLPAHTWDYLVSYQCTM